ncbi:MAG TPA: hypothetical protein VES42_04140, partial [Pilimelia sp.]|nr:hypothetical protein [Pilimelia sp.]
AEPTGVLAYAPGAVARVPDSESVERVLFRLAAAEDVPAFRAVAARLGEWARGAYTAAEPQAVLSFDDLVVDGDGFAPGVSGWVVVRPATGPELLAAAWYRFGDRLAGHRRHPWPPWLVGDDLVSAWLGMSGEEATAEVLKRGRELADELAVVLGEAGAAKAGAAETGAAEAGAADAGVDLRTALADAAAARTQVTELTGHIAGLERTLGYRDKQLRVRENRIRELRDNVRAVQGSRAFKVAMLIRKVAKLRNPRQAARAVKRRLTRR